MGSESDTDRRREQIAFGRLIDWQREAQFGTVFFGPKKSELFPPLPIGNVQSLLENGYLDPNHRHNDAPRASKLVAWAGAIQQRYKQEQLEVGFIGYMVSPNRPDSRVALTGVSIRSPGPIPGALKAEATREFNPDLLTVDDFTIRMKWD
jgi:hypothetical protein